MGNIRIKYDSLTPGLKKLAALGASPRDVLEVGGVELKNMTVEAFGDPGARPAKWPNKKDGTPANLVQSTALRQSISDPKVTGKTATASAAPRVVSNDW